MRSIVLFTAQDIGYRLVEFLGGRKDINALVITRQTTRDALYGYRSAADACDAFSVRKIVTPRIDHDVAESIAAHRPEFIVSAYYPVVIPSAIIDLAPKGGVNVHPGILPKYRGRFPTPWYILNGEREFGVTIHRLAAGVDTGDILVQKLFPIEPDDTGHGLYRRAMDASGDLLIENFDRLLDGEIDGVPQRGVGSYFKSIEKRYHIDWNLGREQIARRIRVHARPYFPAYAFLFNRIVLINRASFVEVSGYSARGGGEIIEVRPDGKFVVSCCDGCLLIEDFALAPEMDPADVASHVRVGNVLE